MQVAKLESLIRMLCDFEDQIKMLDDSQVRMRPKSVSRQGLGLINEHLDSEATSPRHVLPKSNLGQSAAYVFSH
tara:strand:- start:828 stop:1049 length:222 start_codon:yes stop_codon:yes gene_type:complete